MEDCTLEYSLYIENLISSDKGSLHLELESRLAKCLACISPLIGDYIWQNEPFTLRCVEGKGDNPAHLYGRTDFGDNVEDEWFIVYLLTQLTLEFQDICVSLHDSDGDFLLIEAAHYLPKWLKPESSQNRVFLHGGSLHIIPYPSTPREVTIFPAGAPTLFNALRLVFGPNNTTASPKIQQAMRKRIEGYPGAVLQSLHHANLYLPPKVKHVLDTRPSLVSAAVQAFYHREPVDVKACRDMKYFCPRERVMSRVCFTRCLYAQLMQQSFHPDRRSPWQLPHPSSPHYKSHDLGFKLTCGFEILCSRSSGSGYQDNDLPAGPKWERFLDSLKRHGFFKEEIEGSQMYQKLMIEAKTHFWSSFPSSISCKWNMGNDILSVLENVDIDIAKMREEERRLPEEDDDKWLDVSPDDLDAMLESYRTADDSSYCSSNKTTQTASKTDDFDLESVTRSMNAFVDKVSSYEGAEIPSTDEIQFDASSFMDTMKRLLDRDEGNTDESDEEDDDTISDDEEEEFDDNDVEARGKEDKELLSYMKSMDKELAATRIAESFEKEQLATSVSDSQRSASEGACAKSGDVTEEEDTTPVNVDLNLVKNLLESFTSQQGVSGPASNILNSMGIRLPANADKT